MVILGSRVDGRVVMMLDDNSEGEGEGEGDPKAERIGHRAIHVRCGVPTESREKFRREFCGLGSGFGASRKKMVWLLWAEEREIPDSPT